jgi:hypothetical protein
MLDAATQRLSLPIAHIGGIANIRNFFDIIENQLSLLTKISTTI